MFLWRVSVYRGSVGCAERGRVLAKHRQFFATGRQSFTKHRGILPKLQQFFSEHQRAGNVQ